MARPQAAERPPSASGRGLRPTRPFDGGAALSSHPNCRSFVVTTGGHAMGASQRDHSNGMRRLHHETGEQAGGNRERHPGKEHDDGGHRYVLPPIAERQTGPNAQTPGLESERRHVLAGRRLEHLGTLAAATSRREVVTCLTRRFNDIATARECPSAVRLLGSSREALPTPPRRWASAFAVTPWSDSSQQAPEEVGRQGPAPSRALVRPTLTD